MPDTRRTQRQPAEPDRELEPWERVQFPQWKIDLFNEWFDPKPGTAPNPYEGRALRAPGA